MINSVKTGDVQLLSGIFADRAVLNRNYLMSLKNHCLLQNYYLEAGFVIPRYAVINNPETADLHWGWEAPSCQLRGHFLGHWLSAASLLVAQNDDKELKAKLDLIVEELDRCQKANGGKWIAPFPEKYFAILEKGEAIWSPQYTMHKLLMGLLHANMYAGSRKALSIINNLADWYVKWTDKVLKSDAPDAIYRGEEGGMLEIWAELYIITGKQKYLTLAERYASPSIFDSLLAGKDPLSNSHQNASIPYIHGAAKMYEVTGERKYLDILERFWACAVENREAYCTGGQGAGEFWVPPHQLGQFMGERNQEFCTVYNMVRVADYLFKFTGNANYLDFIEKNLYNGFLAQQNKMTGLPAYFLPMKAGSVKKWGTATRDFWCCHGTMVQGQALYPELCYYQKDDEKRIYVAQYIPSVGKFVFDDGKKVTITQSINMSYSGCVSETAAGTSVGGTASRQNSRWLLKFTVEAECDFTLSFRIPEWIAGRPTVTVNGNEIDVPNNCDKCGFLNIKKNWSNQKIIVYLPAALRSVSLSDSPEKFAVMEGPVVLAGLSEKNSGITLDSSGALEKVYRPVKEHTYSTLPWLQSCYRTVNQNEEIDFIPLYEVTDEKYTLYWTRKN